jgi:tetratricopeptide (TPR) repeat protein
MTEPTAVPRPRASQSAPPSSSSSQIETLEAKGLVRLASVRPEIEYLFRHWLVQDAAYGSLLRQERRALHARVGQALEELYPERRAELAAVLAMHFEQAAHTDKAIEYYLAAGNYGLERYAIREAYAAFTRAANLLPPPLPADDEATRRRRVEVVFGRAQAGYSLLSPEEALSALEAIVPEAEALADPELAGRVHMLIALGRLQSGEKATDPSVKRSLDRMAEIGEQIADPSLRAMPLALVGMNDVFAGEIRDGVRALEEAMPLLEGRKDSIGAAFARGALAIGYAYLGRFEEAEAAAIRAREIAEQGDVIAKLDALIAESLVYSARGNLEAAVPLAQSCVNKAEESGATACILASSWILGDAYHRMGRFAEARDALQRGAEVSRVVERKVWRPTLQAWLGATAQALGVAASTDWDEALATARSIHNRYGEAGILAKRGEAAAARGEIEAALADFGAAALILEQEAARPALARVLRGWGDVLRTAGRAEEAAPLLQRSRDLFEELGLDAEAAAVQALLAVGDDERP